MGTDPVALRSKTALNIRRWSVRSWMSLEKLLEDMQGDYKARGSGMFILSYGEHSVRIVVIDRFGECADGAKVHLSFLG